MASLKQFLAEILKEHGVEHVFGVPADFVLEFYKHLETSKDIKAIRMNDEPQAGFAADAYARIKGLSAVVVTYGAGGFKVVNSTAQAYVEDSPVLVISGAPGKEEYERGKDFLNFRIHHVVKGIDDQLRVFENVTGRAVRIDDIYTAKSQIHGLIHYIRDQKKPGYLEIPRDMWGKQLPETESSDRYYYVKPSSMAKTLNSAVEISVERIRQAKKPVFWAGTGVQRFKLNETLLKIAEKSNIPIVTSLFGKSAIDDSEKMHLGVYVGAQSASNRYDDDEVREYVETSDCVIMLGVNFSDFNFGIGTVDINDKATLINAQHEYVRIGAAEFRNVLLNDFVSGLEKGNLGKHKFKEPKKAAQTKPPQNGDEINSDLFFSLLNRYIDENTIVISDIGDCLFGAGRLNTSFSHFLAPGVYGSMGWAVSASLGAELASKPNRPFVIVGDGAMVMGQESTIAKQVELGLGPVIFVLNNKGYATLEGAVSGSFNKLVDYNFDFLTQVYGGKGYRVSTVGELIGVLESVKEFRNIPAVVNVILPQFDRTTILKKISAELGKGVPKQD